MLESGEVSKSRVNADNHLAKSDRENFDVDYII